MKWEDINRQSCSVARSLFDIGERWTLLLIRDAMAGATKFEDFVERSGAGRNLVADRLHKLVTAGILKAERYQEKPDRFSYVLTEKGSDLYPVLMALVRWGDKWHDDGSGPPVVHYHNTCGQQMHAVVTCSACGKEIDPMETRAARDPALPYWKYDGDPA